MIEKRYLSASSYFKEKYGKKFRRLPIDAGFSCPGRCIYCSSYGSLANESALIVKSEILNGTRISRISLSLDINSRLNLIKSQIENFLKKNQIYVLNDNDLNKNTIKIQNEINKKNLLYLYFQAFSNTYDTTDNLRKIYDFSLSLFKFDGIFIGTRPDCIDEQKVELISQYSKDYDVWIELGLQSKHKRTLQYINRIHDAESFSKATILLKSYGIKVIAHIIVGLYDEKVEDLIETVKFLSELKIDGIKFHNLYILPNTEILKYYERGIQRVQSAQEYIEQVANAIQYLRKDIVIFRLFADPEENHIAPKWKLNKTQLINMFDNYCLKNDIFQGKLWEKD